MIVSQSSLPALRSPIRNSPITLTACCTPTTSSGKFITGWKIHLPSLSTSPTTANRASTGISYITGAKKAWMSPYSFGIAKASTLPSSATGIYSNPPPPAIFSNCLNFISEFKLSTANRTTPTSRCANPTTQPPTASSRRVTSLSEA